jgi:hypothetical protein
MSAPLSVYPVAATTIITRSHVVGLRTHDKDDRKNLQRQHAHQLFVAAQHLKEHVGTSEPACP